MRGLDEKICTAFAPKPCAISSDELISPAMDVCIPMRMLPSFHAGISGAVVLPGGTRRRRRRLVYCCGFLPPFPLGVRVPYESLCGQRLRAPRAHMLNHPF